MHYQNSDQLSGKPDLKFTLCMKNVYAGFSLVRYNSFVLICAVHVLSFPPGVCVGILNLTVQSLYLCAFCFTLLTSL